MMLFHTCTCVGNVVSEAGIDLEIIEVGVKDESFSDEVGFSDEAGDDDEISSEIQELTAKESREVSIFTYVCTNHCNDILCIFLPNTVAIA